MSYMLHLGNWLTCIFVVITPTSFRLIQKKKRLKLE